jgi:hypothetical protein
MYTVEDLQIYFLFSFPCSIKTSHCQGYLECCQILAVFLHVISVNIVTNQMSIKL